ncbi:MAG: MmgE/PrpD family protein [Rhizobiales bacterium]|nr:MmgE/PrpD family protein [Hyphomicrobiales bacterium]
MTEMQSLPEPSPTFGEVAAFVLQRQSNAFPPEVIAFARLLMLDLLGVAAAASGMDAGRIAREHAARHWSAGAGAPGARMIFDGRRVSLPGAAFAIATQIDNLDAHDGWQPSKGHGGAALLPALVAFAEAEKAVSGPDALAAFIIGYEVAYRSAWALHATTTCYHTSGAWNALGCTAIGARLRSMPADVFRHALGIAEYHAPRSQMMREVANPSMLHDGTGWGAPTGVYATLIAEDGFTGAPAATVEFDDARFAWGSLGEDWLTNKQYIKPYPTCRWTHAPIDAVLAMRAAHKLTSRDVAAIEITSFQYAIDLAMGVPASSPVAQYSLAWPVAAALVRGHVTVDEIIEGSFGDPEIGRLTRATRGIVDPVIERTYPERRLARVTLVLTDGTRLESGEREASGGPLPLPSEAEVRDKFKRFAGPVLGEARTARIEEMVLGLATARSDFKALIDELAAPGKH